jgi:hypothetical protein
MAFISDYTGTLLDQVEQPQDQDESQFPHQSTFQDSYLHLKVIQWKSPRQSHESATQDTSTQILSPIMDTVNETVSIINEGYPTPLRTNELSLSSFYGYALRGHNHQINCHTRLFLPLPHIPKSGSMAISTTLSTQSIAILPFPLPL